MAVGSRHTRRSKPGPETGDDGLIVFGWVTPSAGAGAVSSEVQRLVVT